MERSIPADADRPTGEQRVSPREKDDLYAAAAAASYSQGTRVAGKVQSFPIFAPSILTFSFPVDSSSAAASSSSSTSTSAADVMRALRFVAVALAALPRRLTHLRGA